MLQYSLDSGQETSFFWECLYQTISHQATSTSHQLEYIPLHVVTSLYQLMSIIVLPASSLRPSNQLTDRNTLITCIDQPLVLASCW